MDAQGQVGTTQIHLLLRRATRGELKPRGTRVDIPRSTPPAVGPKARLRRNIHNAVDPRFLGTFAIVFARPQSILHVPDTPFPALPRHSGTARPTSRCLRPSQDASTVAPRLPRPRTVLGERDPENDHPEKKPPPRKACPPRATSRATSSAYDWDDDIPELPERKRADDIDHERSDGKPTERTDSRVADSKIDRRGDRTVLEASSPEDASPRRDEIPPTPVSERTVPTRTLRVPVYSVAGRRLSAHDLLREKIRNTGTDSRHARRLLARIVSADADGRIGRSDLGAVLRRFNLDSGPDTVDSLASRFQSRDGNERCLLSEFLRWALPDQSCAATDVGPGTASGARRPATARVRMPPDEPAWTARPSRPSRPSTARDARDAFPPTVSPAPGNGLSSRDAEALLREKMREKFGDGGKRLRQAFRHFDRDDDGFINEDEFWNVLRGFFVYVEAWAFEDLFLRLCASETRESRASKRGISRDAFVEFFGAGNPAPSKRPEASSDARKEASKKCDEAFQNLEAAFAKTRRRVQTETNTNTSRLARSMRQRGVHVPESPSEPALTLLEARAALGKEGDPALVRRLKSVSDASVDGFVARSAALRVAKRCASGTVDAAAKETTRDFDGRDGGGNGGPSAILGIETCLREKLDARRISGERAFRLLFDRKGKGWIDREGMARVLHEFNVPASAEEVAALVAKHDGAWMGKMTARHFCRRLLRTDFPNAENAAARSADRVVACFHRALCDALEKKGERVTRRDALAAAARATKNARASLGASAASAAADAAALSFSEDVISRGAFIAACQRAVRAAEETVAARAPHREPVGLEALGGDRYEPVFAKTPPRFPTKTNFGFCLKTAREKFHERMPARGASEIQKCARLFDPDHAGYVTFEAFRTAMNALGLGTIDEETMAAAFARLASRMNTGDPKNVTPATSAFVRAFLPPRVAVDRPEKKTVLAALVRSKAVTESDVRDVLAACDVEVEDPAHIARLIRRSAAIGGEGTLDYAQLAVMVSRPETVPRRIGSPTPAVNHCDVEDFEVRNVSPQTRPTFPPTPPER